MNGYYPTEYNQYTEQPGYNYEDRRDEGNINHQHQNYNYNGYSTYDGNAINSNSYYNQHPNSCQYNYVNNPQPPSENVNPANVNYTQNYLPQPDTSQYTNNYANQGNHISPPTINPSTDNYQNGQFNSYNQMTNSMQNMNINSQNSPINHIDLMQTKYLFSEEFNEELSYTPETHYPMNCNPSIMQCTMNMLPVDDKLLQKTRLPLGVHVQPFRDLADDELLVSNGPIVRCKSCRTYINPFVSFTDHYRRWHCNVCGKINDIPDEFMYDPVTKSYGNPSKRPEVQYCSIEYVAQAEYSVRPPMATTYIFCLDVSQPAIESGYLTKTCQILRDNLDNIPGDKRTKIAFLTYSSSLQFYMIQENTYKMMSWPDISMEEPEIPLSEDLLIQLHERKDVLKDFLENLPSVHYNEISDSISDSKNCLGFALQVAIKMIGKNGGRITVLNGSLPNIGIGALERRFNDTNMKTSSSSNQFSNKMLQIATPYYKTLALKCANDQITVDLFAINNHYSDLASLAAISRHSSGSFQYYGQFQAESTTPLEQLDYDRFTKDFTRYLTRKIGFEAVMRTRVSRELEVTGFHGNLFMRSTNVISLPVVSPDAGYAIQFKYTGSLYEWNYAIIQSALLYTTSQSERRIRVHTLCIPISDRPFQIFSHVNLPAVVGLVAKIAIDRTISDGPQVVKEAFFNSVVDPLKAYRQELSLGGSRHANSLLCSEKLRLLPLYVSALIRNPAFRSSTNPDCTFAMLEYIRTSPLLSVLRTIYPMMVPVHDLLSNIPLAVKANDAPDNFPRPSRLSLSNSVLSRDGAYLIDAGVCFYIFISHGVDSQFIQKLLSTQHTSITQYIQSEKQYIMPIDTDIHNDRSILFKRLATLHSEMSHERQTGKSLIIVPQDSGPLAQRIINCFIEDRLESALSYYEFIKSVQSAVYS